MISWVWIPTFFILLSAGILLVGVIRVGRILSRERMALLNFKFMALHFIFLFVWSIATFLAFNGNVNALEGNKLWYWTFYSLTNFGVNCFMAFILWRASGKKKKLLPCSPQVLEKCDSELMSQMTGDIESIYTADDSNRSFDEMIMDIE